MKNNGANPHNANAIRFLAMDAVQQANSGHPGMPMGMADIAEVLWNRYLKHNPADPSWANRDRFVLSNGHGSMLLYALLHLSGYDLPMEELKNFRQLHSKTPGHPEYGYTPGVETTTGPLGQGLANAVGMALAEKMLAAEFNQPGHNIIDHRTWVFIGDGCLMEGISHEACSLAGTLKLGKLIVFYDDNGISIDGEVEGWFTDNTGKRFESYGWHVLDQVDGHQPEQISAAIEQAVAEVNQPTLICCKTKIGSGSPNKQDTESCHGAPLGHDEIAATREALGWKSEPFEISDDIYAAWDARERGNAEQSAWEDQYQLYAQGFPELASELNRRLAGNLPTDWNRKAEEWIECADAQAESVATRKASQSALSLIGQKLPELVGGSADLTGSNLTCWDGASAVVSDFSRGRHINYGVREFAMSAINNGLVLHGGFKAFCGTFLMFSEYARNALRMAALMKVPSIYVYTHDSIGLGEDGPTHQPVEQIATLRLIPNMEVWRPCDGVETMVAWSIAIENNNGPTSLLFSRQSLDHQVRSHDKLGNIKRGGYILRDCLGTPSVILLATGSEVNLAMQAAEKLTDKGCATRVVSMPCAERFEQQDEAYREQVLPQDVRARVAVEAGVTDWWRKYTGLDGAIVGIDRFGESAPAQELFKHFGLTVEAIVDAAQSVAGITVTEAA